MLMNLSKPELEELIHLTQAAYQQVADSLDSELGDYPATILSKAHSDIWALNKKLHKIVEKGESEA